MISLRVADLAAAIGHYGIVRSAMLLISALIVLAVAKRLYGAFLGPLSRFPGPKWRALSSVPQALTIFKGREHIDYVDLHKKYGDIVRIAPNELSFAGGADVWKDVMGFKKMGGSAFNKDHRFYGGEILDQPNSFMVNADDREHSKLRRVVSHAFADKSLRDVEPRLHHCAAVFKTRLDESQRLGAQIDMVKLYNCGTFDVMGDLAFNEDLGMLANGDENVWVTNIFRGIKHAAMIRGFKVLHNFFWWLVDNVIVKIPAARREIGKTLDYTTERLDRRLASPPNRPDLWTQITAKGVGDQSLHRAEHQGLAFFFMVAGTETTASALSGITYFLLNNKEYANKLRQEVRAAFATLEDVTFAKLGSLPYLNAVIQEGLRMYPPVPIALPRRSPKQGGEVAGVYIPGNVVCSVPHYSTNHNPRHFTEPDTFRPERWLGDPKYANDNLSAVEVFHVGPRNCVGKNLAWHEMRLFLGTAFAFFDLDLAPQSQDWLVQNEVYTVWQKPPLWCHVGPRSDA